MADRRSVRGMGYCLILENGMESVRGVLVVRGW